jgi:glycosyltransferase involved in cell wall biosynthesis
MKIAVIFDDFSDIHINKDVGLIGLALSECLGAGDVTAYTRQIISDEANRLARDLGLKISSYICDSSFIFSLYVIVNLILRRVDLVVLFHATPSTAIRTILLRLVGIKVYIKLDMNVEDCDTFLKKLISNKCRYFIYKISLKIANVITVEQQKIFDSLKTNRWLEPKLVHLPNSIYKKSIPPVSLTERKRRIIVVGRIGVYEKNHELILQALIKSQENLPEDFELNFLGKPSEDFSIKYNELLYKNPVLIDKVKLMGQLTRTELFEFYRSSCFFLMPSRVEGFSLAMLEAAYMGCLIISTAVGGAEDLTKNFLYGYKLNQNDVDQLSKFFINLADYDDIFESTYKQRMEYIREYFDLNKNILKVVKKIYG